MITEHGDINNYTELPDETIQGTKDSSNSAPESRNHFMPVYTVLRGAFNIQKILNFA